MQGRFAAILVSISCIATGCLNPQVATRGMMERLRAVSGPIGADVLVMDVAIIEQSPGDAFLDRDLWATVDEQAVALDRKAGLDDNGFRVGVVGGLPPRQLQELLFNNRSCPDPHRITTRSGNVKNIPIGASSPNCQFDARLNGELKTISLTNAQSGFTITPHRTNDGRVRIHFTPHVQHGNRALTIQPSDGESWSLVGNRPIEKFSDLAFDVTISPQQYVLVGTHFDRYNTLAYEMFCRRGGKPNQRLLVIRARPQGEAPALEWTRLNDEGRTAPLALQASLTTRGTRD